MRVEFDPAKDKANVEKHGVSLARAVDLSDVLVVRDNRFEELRFRLYGLIDGAWFCAAVTVRDDAVRVISLRRAHLKEVRRYEF